MRHFSLLLRAPLLALGLAAPPGAGADCSRDIVVPVAPIGLSVIVNGGAVSGIYPELLRSLGAKAGCNFVFSAVPRARLEAMFEAGTADLLLPATGTPRRDLHGRFVPLMGNRPMLISVQSPRAPILNVQELIERREMRIALVRGYDYGETYQALVKELTRQGRVYLEVDTLSVARLLHGGFADATIMAPTILSGTIIGDARVQGMADRLRLEALPELPWGLSGAYISKKSLTPEDQTALRDLLERAAKSGALLDSFQRHYRPEILSSSIRPR
ncbi:substrate-binding periplasmic protein [Janthinobacterium fluminis]|uniref:Transporter substrate-binding domain-containing protein n=1 Tax=Janthinobacterium fluminis TaxID=2987524 RepID=A0ABT5JWU4_9BURK|nr:transporter substrate-binding domain-containing protein [Janthinobacterium fluminis]MDC8756536.1 transporter substrate-binding domain-containing protein [Janthinobacterium fluminis]